MQESYPHEIRYNDAGVARECVVEPRAHVCVVRVIRAERCQQDVDVQYDHDRSSPASRVSYINRLEAGSMPGRMPFPRVNTGIAGTAEGVGATQGRVSIRPGFDLVISSHCSMVTPRSSSSGMNTSPRYR